MDDANFAQNDYREQFSKGGKEALSEIVGSPIETIDDLAQALQNGQVSPDQIPVQYVIRDGNTLILNTRTSQALTQAGIPRNQWNAVNVTGDAFFEQNLTNQLVRNGLTSTGTSTVVPQK